MTVLAGAPDETLLPLANAFVLPAQWAALAAAAGRRGQ